MRYIPNHIANLYSISHESRPNTILNLVSHLETNLSKSNPKHQPRSSPSHDRQQPRRYSKKPKARHDMIPRRLYKTMNNTSSDIPPRKRNIHPLILARTRNSQRQGDRVELRRLFKEVVVIVALPACRRGQFQVELAFCGCVVESFHFVEGGNELAVHPGFHEEGPAV